MLGDNQGALVLTENPYFYERSKYIDIIYYYIRDLVEKEKVFVEYIPIDCMTINRIIKPLQQIAFERFKELIGIVID
jgi:hypothetical protein